jgi:hypothetical protein
MLAEASIGAGERTNTNHGEEDESDAKPHGHLLSDARCL